jgi:hypothetical protein
MHPNEQGVAAVAAAIRAATMEIDSNNIRIADAGDPYTGVKAFQVPFDGFKSTDQMELQPNEDILISALEWMGINGWRALEIPDQRNRYGGNFIKRKTFFSGLKRLPFLVIVKQAISTGNPKISFQLCIAKK